MKQYLFQVIENGRNHKDEYVMMMTDKEMTAYLNTKQEMNGYVSGLGGDKTYSIVAWHLN